MCTLLNVLPVVTCITDSCLGNGIAPIPGDDATGAGGEAELGVPQDEGVVPDPLSIMQALQALSKVCPPQAPHSCHACTHISKKTSVYEWQSKDCSSAAIQSSSHASCKAQDALYERSTLCKDL